MNLDKEYKKAKLLSFGDMIRKLRVNKGMTAKSLAEKSHLTMVTVLKVEQGKLGKIRPTTLLKLEKVLKFDAREYMDLTRE